jgi:hypothetical protein
MVVLLALALGGCERPETAPAKADSAPAALPQGPDVRRFMGQTWAEFSADPEMAAFALETQGLSEDEAARFATAQGAGAPAIWLAGGGAEALVFQGCAAQGCDAGVSVMAIDHQTGETFIGVRDPLGTTVLVPNLRLEALLRLASASGAWDDPTPRAPPAGP